MNWLFSLYVAILFFILTPAVLLRIPKKGSKYMVAGVHAIVFALLLHFTGKFVWNVSMSMEGFQEGADAKARGAAGSTAKKPEIKAGSAADDQKKIQNMQKKNEDDCAKKQGFKWNAEKKTCNSDPNAKPPPKDEKKLAAMQAQAKAKTEAKAAAPAPTKAPAKKK
jgi:hypothetical protein